MGIDRDKGIVAAQTKARLRSPFFDVFIYFIYNYFIYKICKVLPGEERNTTAKAPRSAKKRREEKRRERVRLRGRGRG
jgi:hypothetical protein